MGLQINNLKGSVFAVVILFLFFLSSCDKADITFGATDAASDPNITYYDNFAVDLATYKPDSFITSGHNVIAAGYHTDTALGVMKAGAYMQIALPSTNPVLNENAVFDSLELVLKPSGEFYGDSTLPVTIKVHQLTKNIYNENGDTYYNTSAFAYSPAVLAQKTVLLYGKAGTEIKVRLANATGQEWFDKFRTGDDAVASTEKFIDYFKGLFITTDSAQTKAVTFFNLTADSPVVRLHYHLRDLYGTAKHLDFLYTAARQFSNMNYRFTNAKYTALNTNKSKLLPSTESGNQAVLNTGFVSSIKMTFSGLLDLKEKHPYVKIVKAILIIRPDAATYSFPYQLPQSLYLYQTDDGNLPGLGIFNGGSSTAGMQTGSLSVDYLYGENTTYSYDITSFINSKIAEGEFSKSALLLTNTLSNYDGAIQRIFINNQKGTRPIQLKLFVLGL